MLQLYGHLVTFIMKNVTFRPHKMLGCKTGEEKNGYEARDQLLYALNWECAANGMQATR